MSKTTKTKYIVITALLSALATALMYLEFGLPFLPSFLQIDFSNIPSLIGALYGGPACGVAICLIKNVIHLAVSKSFFVGELCDFLLGASLTLATGITYSLSKKKGISSAIFAACAGTVAMTAAAFPINYYISFPFYISVYFQGNADTLLSIYQTFLPFVEKLSRGILLINLPFTFVKGIINVIPALIIFSRLSRYKGHHNEKHEKAE